jgi:hypothetical protein
MKKRIYLSIVCSMFTVVSAYAQLSEEKVTPTGVNRSEADAKQVGDAPKAIKTSISPVVGGEPTTIYGTEKVSQSSENVGEPSESGNISEQENIRREAATKAEPSDLQKVATPLIRVNSQKANPNN